MIDTDTAAHLLILDQCCARDMNSVPSQFLERHADKGDNLY